ncbi:hypothetical protein scyTo_0000264 [Scyliorhinus torazame]|uniref:Uncharacterized protein n=1 Tax=Scyliorhinus torazame TaxID=75743 RepID=A0A401NTW7_SCYTO|nr:hypothetical protein [Scyliorhinus torazame]
MASDKPAPLPVNVPPPAPAGAGEAAGLGPGGGTRGLELGTRPAAEMVVGSMVSISGINPSVPIRNIKMKFAVVIGLIQVGEVSNRDIVETVLNLNHGIPTVQKKALWPIEPAPTL